MTQRHCLEGQVYSVPLIQPEVRREEAVHQITDALLYLESISTDIFRRQDQYTHTLVFHRKDNSAPVFYFIFSLSSHIHTENKRDPNQIFFMYLFFLR